jgi:hypothetical protein
LRRLVAWLIEARSARMVLAIGIGLIVADLVVLGPFSYYKMHDNGEFLVAILRAVARNFPDLGLLYPNGMAGVDRVAQGAFGGLDALLFWLLPDWLALQLMTVAMIAACGLFTYRLGIDHFDGTPLMAALAGIVAGWAVGTAELHQYSMALTPGLVWGVESIRRDGKDRRAYIVLGALILWYATTAHIQFLLLVHGPVLFLWLTVVFPTARPRAWIAALAVLAVPVLLRLQDLVAAALFSPQSHRLNWTAEPAPSWLEMATYPWYLPEIVVAAVLVSGALATPGRRGLVLRLLALAGFLQISLILAPWLKSQIVDWLPVLNGVNVGRAAAAAGVMWAVALAATPLPSIAQPRRRAALLAGAAATLVFLIGQEKLSRAEEYVRLGNFVANFHSNQLERLADRIAGDMSFPRVEPIKVTPMLLQGYGLETLGGYFTLFTERYQRYWNVMNAPLARTDPDAFAKMEGWGNRLLLHARRPDPQSALADYADHDLISLAGVRYIVSKNPLSDPQLTLLEGPSSPWDGLSNADKLVVNLKANFTGFERFYIYENPRALPRFFVPGRLDLMPDVDSVLRALAERGLDDLTAAAPALATDWRSPPPAQDIRGRVLAVRRSVDAYRLNVDFPSAGVLAASLGYSPWWHANLVADDGSRVPLTVAPLYHAFVGIAVPRGTGTVEILYMPPHRLGGAP